MNYELLEIVVCPICKKKLNYDELGKELICRTDKLAYPFQDGIPVLLKDEARMIS